MSMQGRSSRYGHCSGLIALSGRFCIVPALTVVASARATNGLGTPTVVIRLFGYEI